MRQPAGLRSPAPDPKPRGAAWKWGITHAGDARSPKSTAAPSPWDLVQVNPPPPRDQRASNRPAHADDHRSGSQTPAGAAEPDDASAPDPAKLDAERPQARAHERGRIYDGDQLVVGFASAWRSPRPPSRCCSGDSRIAFVNELAKPTTKPQSTAQ